MKKAIYLLICAFLILQVGILIYGCGSVGSSSSTSTMSNTAALSLVIKDAKTGAKLPMSAVFINSSSKVSSSSIRTKSTLSGWDQTTANNMGYAEITNVSADGTAMLKVTKDGYDDYSQVVNVGKTVSGYTIDIVSTTDDATTQPTIEVYNPIAAPSSSSGVYACSDSSTCMKCGCPTTGTGGCGGGCGCTDSSTNCQGGKCRQNNSTITNFSNSKCTDTGCPPNCKNCGACSCSAAGNCKGQANCQVQGIPSATSGGGGVGGGCGDGACPTGCSGCGACNCTSAGGCGGLSHCTGGAKIIGGGTSYSGGGGCSGAGCPTGCRNCGACSCADGTGSCTGSSHCVSTGGGGSGSGGGSSSGGGSVGAGCYNCNSCTTNPCHGCSCVAGGTSACASHGAAAWCNQQQ